MGCRVERQRGDDGRGDGNSGDATGTGAGVFSGGEAELRERLQRAGEEKRRIAASACAALFNLSQRSQRFSHDDQPTQDTSTSTCRPRVRFAGKCQPPRHRRQHPTQVAEVEHLDL